MRDDPKFMSPLTAVSVRRVSTAAGKILGACTVSEREADTTSATQERAPWVPRSASHLLQQALAHSGAAHRIEAGGGVATGLAIHVIRDDGTGLARIGLAGDA